MRSPHLADTSCKEWSRAGVEKDDRPQVQPRAMFARRPAAVIFAPRAKCSSQPIQPGNDKHVAGLKPADRLHQLGPVRLGARYSRP
jgi:hypothetical protein